MRCAIIVLALLGVLASPRPAASATLMTGERDKRPFGDGNGKVSPKELKKYLDGNRTHYARRYYGITQTAQIVVNGRELLAAN